jgi:uncharacterized membrane protein
LSANLFVVRPNSNSWKQKQKSLINVFSKFYFENKILMFLTWKVTITQNNNSISIIKVLHVIKSTIKPVWITTIFAIVLN